MVCCGAFGVVCYAVNGAYRWRNGLRRRVVCSYSNSIGVALCDNSAIIGGCRVVIRVI